MAALGLEHVHEVIHLGLDHVDHRRMSQTRSRAHQHRQVGETVDGRALVRAHALAPPHLRQRLALAAVNQLERRRIGDVEAGAHDQDVDGALGAVGGGDRMSVDPLDRIGDQVDVVAGDRREVRVRDQHALAADGELRGQLLPQLAVADLHPQHAQRGRLDRRHEVLVPGQAGNLHLAEEPVLPANHLPQTGHVAQRGTLPPEVGAVQARDHERRRALVDVQVADERRDLRDDLDRRGARADHRNALSAQVRVVVPPRGVEDLALELPDALDVRQARLAQCADAEHQFAHRPRGGLRGGAIGSSGSIRPSGSISAGGAVRSGGTGGTSGGALPEDLVHVLPGRRHPGDGVTGVDLMRKLARGHQPAARGIVPAGIDHLRAEIDVRVQALLHRDAALVVGDLRLRAEAARPVEVLRERQGVQVAGHVARRTRVGVVAPGPADLVAAVDDPEILDALAQQVGSGGETGEARADDQDVGFLRGMVHGPNDSPRRAEVGRFPRPVAKCPECGNAPPEDRGRMR